MAITLQLPDSIAEALAREWPDLNRKALEAVALEGYRQEALSQGQVGELLGLSFAETETFLKAHDAPLRYAEEDLEADLQAARRLAGR